MTGHWQAAARGRWALASLGFGLIAWLGLGLWTGVLAAQEGPISTPLLGEMRPRFESLTTEDGLPSNTVETFFQDSQGFLWVGTWGGLARYDGYSFTTFRHHADDPASLNGDVVHDLAEDRDGFLWVGTNAGLARFDPRTERFTRFLHDPDDPTSLSFPDVFRLLLNADGTLWIATGGGGLDFFDPGTGRFTHYLHDPEDPTSLGNNEVRALYSDREGTLWVGTQGGGLNRFDATNGTFRRFLRDPDNPGSLGDDGVWTIFEDRHGSLWVGTNDAGLNRFDRATGRFTRYEPEPGVPGRLGGKFVFDGIEGRDGDLWLTLHDGGLQRFDPTTGLFTGYLPDPLDPHAILSSALTTIYEDDLGALWIGTFTSGISKLDRGAAKFRLYRHHAGDEQSLIGDQIQAVLEDRAGVLWIGSDGRGLSRFDPRTRTYRHYVHDSADPTSLSNNKVQVLYQDRSGELWVGTWGRGLNRFDPARDSFRRYVHDPDDPSSLGSDDVRGLHETRDGTLWVATAYGGLNRLDRATETFTRYLHDPEDPESKGQGVITVLTGDGEGGLWLGLWGGGLNRFDPSGDRFIRYEADDEDPSALAHNEIWALYRDTEERLWIGTGGGLDLFDPQTETFSHFRTEDGLPNNVVHVIVSDREGFLWLGTGNGLCHFDPRQRTCRTYDRPDGLQGQGWTDGGALLARSGEVFIGGPGGLNAFFPEEITSNPLPPPVALTGFQLFNRPVEIGGEGSPLLRSILYTDGLTLHHDQSVFTLTFAGLAFRSPEKNRYRYRLAGVETRWNEVDSGRRYATYTTLPPGDYRFEVQASNNDGLWSRVGRSLNVRVLPPLWGTWWFRGIGALLLGVLAWAGYQWRTAEIRTRNLALRGEIEERKKVEVSLSESNRLLEEKNAELERFAYSVSHDLMNPLVTIRGFAGALRSDLDRGNRHKVIDDLDRIDSAADKMQQLLKDLLELTRVGRVEKRWEPVDLTVVAEEASSLVRGALEDRGVEVEIAAGMPTVLGHPGRLREVFQNLLENAAKFMGEQPHPRIEVRAGIENGKILCTVQDNGLGIDPAYHEKVFELFHRLDPTTEGTGVGLALVHRIMKLHDGRIWVESEGKGSGSRFQLAFPEPTRALVREPATHSGPGGADGVR